MIRKAFTMELRRLTTYRLDFWVTNVVSLVAQMLVVWYLWQSIYEVNPQAVIGGYSFGRMLYYYLLAFLVDKMVRGRDHEGIAGDIYSGGLNKYLVYPINLFWYQFAKHQANSLFGLMQTVLFLSLAIPIVGLPSEVHFSLAGFAMGIVSVFLATFMFFCMNYILNMCAFWADNVWSLVIILSFASNILGGSYIPLNFFPEWGQVLVKYLPFAHMTYIPVRAFTGDLTVYEWFESLTIVAFWSAVLSPIVALVWKKGLRSYSGVGI